MSDDHAVGRFGFTNMSDTRVTARRASGRCGGGRVEPVVDAPQHGVGSAGHADLAVGGADVGLDGVDAEVHHLGDLGVGPALRDEREDLRLAIGEAFGAPGPVEPGGGRDRGGGSLMTTSPSAIASMAVTSSRAGSVLER